MLPPPACKGNLTTAYPFTFTHLPKLCIHVHLLICKMGSHTDLVTAPPAGPDMHRPHTRVQCLLAVSCRLALHASDMNYPLQSGLALCLLSGVAGCSPVFKLLHACAKFASTAPGRASQQAQAVPGTCLEIAT